MRITNRMMTNNMLYNINGNKNALSTLEQQYSTGLKIQRPSEDPIVAVRALKLRTNLSELNQYYEKNIPDARAWMDVTESALRVVNSILTEVHTYCVQGANDPLTAQDRNSIVENLKELKQQIYQEGDTNYAGRYVFTGYKTDTSLIFGEAQSNEKYTITEKLTSDNIDIVKREVNEFSLDMYDADDPEATDFSNKPNMLTTYRMRLAYGDIDTEDEGGMEIQVRFPTTEDDGTVTYEDYNGPITTMLSSDLDAYNVPEGEIHFLSDTGEIVMAEDVYNEWRYIENIEITYDKTDFSKNELRPEHYFDCTVTDLEDPEKEPITYTKQNQEIAYEVNFNQKLVINTQGSDAIQHGIGRTIDELLNVVDAVTQIEAKIAEVEKMLQDDNINAKQEKALNEMLDMMKTELTLKTEVMQDTFESALTEVEKHQDTVNVAVADLGSRYVRLNLTESRLADEQTDFEDLLSSNEDADMVETIIKYQSMQSIYNASLSAAAKSVQVTLLDFL